MNCKHGYDSDRWYCYVEKGQKPDHIDLIYHYTCSRCQSGPYARCRTPKRRNRDHHQERIQTHLETMRLRPLVERRHKTRFWGKDHFVKPRLLTDILGNGKKLIWLQPIDTRPNYYVARIDSSWSTSNWDPPPNTREWLDDLYQKLEEEFGDGRDHEGEMRNSAHWPEALLDTGSSWGEYDWPKDFLKEKTA